VSFYSGLLKLSTPPPGWLAKIGPHSASLSNFLWNGLTKETRAVYQSGQKAWETFTGLNQYTPYPATVDALGEFIVARAVGGLGINRVSPDTIQANLSAIRSMHIDCRLDDSALDSLWVKRVLAGVRRSYKSPGTKQAAPMTEEMLRRITYAGPPDVEILDLSGPQEMNLTEFQELNFAVASKVAHAGFLRTGEFTVLDSQAKEDPETTKNTRLTRSDITFSADDSHVILRLKRSKADTEHKGVDVVLAASPGSSICPVMALRKLFRARNLPGSHPLFGWGSKPMRRTWFLTMMRKKLKEVGEPIPSRYSGHSFRRGAAQKAYDNGLTEADIQALGRWNSDSFKHYYSQSLQQRLDLNRRFLSRSSRLLSPPPEVTRFSDAAR
jgi:hypothetical protein